MKRTTVFLLIFFISVQFLSAVDRGFYLIESDSLSKELTDQFVLIAREVNGESYYYLGQLLDGEVIDTGVYLPVLTEEGGSKTIYQPLMTLHEGSDSESLEGSWDRDPVLGSVPVTLKKVYDLDPVYIAGSVNPENMLAMSLTELLHLINSYTSLEIKEYSNEIKSKTVVWDVVIRNVIEDNELNIFRAEFSDATEAHDISGILHHIPADAAWSLKKGDLVRISAEITSVGDKDRRVYLKFLRIN